VKAGDAGLGVAGSERDEGYSLLTRQDRGNSPNWYWPDGSGLRRVAESLVVAEDCVF
jgi:hypothetical protein